MFLELTDCITNSELLQGSHNALQSRWQAKWRLAFRGKVPSFLKLKLKAVASYEALVNGMTFYKTIFLL
jgi:hypothetical protein